VQQPNFTVAPNTERLHHVRKDMAVAQRSDGLVSFGPCGTCGKEILKPKSATRPGRHVYKYCNDECYRKSLIKIHPWENEAVALYTESTFGFKKVAKIIGAYPHAVRNVLFRRGVLDFETKKKLENERRKREGLNGDRISIALGEKIIFQNYKSESYRLRKFDEQRHWGKHPEVARFTARKSSFNKYQSLSKEQRRAYNFKVVARRDPERYKANLRSWKRNKNQTDPGFRLRNILSSRLYNLLKKKHNSDVLIYLGCSKEYLIKHLETQFRRGMSWANYGTYWQVDHIIPCAVYDHANIEQVKLCWNWQNLRPLESEKNLAKSATITEPQQHLPLCL
jgi:5-methylcytosine-specific restriction endonuclease McrA